MKKRLRKTMMNMYRTYPVLKQPMFYYDYLVLGEGNGGISNEDYEY